MSNLKNYIKKLSYKTILLFYLLSMISLSIANSSKLKYENGYLFFFSFFLIFPLVILGIFVMLRVVYQLEGPPRDPFYLLKYSAYFIIIVLSSAPFLYLWGMRDVIRHLKW